MLRARASVPNETRSVREKHPLQHSNKNTISISIAHLWCPQNDDLYRMTPQDAFWTSTKMGIPAEAPLRSKAENDAAIDLSLVGQISDQLAILSTGSARAVVFCLPTRLLDINRS